MRRDAMRRSRKLAIAVAATATATLCVTQAGAAVAQTGSSTGLGPATVFSQQPLTAQEAAALSQNANTPVIVMMRDQPAMAAPNTAAGTTRSHDITTNQAPVVSELSQVHAKHVKAYKVANAV